MRLLASGFLVAAAIFAASCDKLDTSRTVEPYSSFGAAVYREGCQRVAYTGQLDQKNAGLRKTVDVSGQYGRAVCVDNMPPPADAPPILSAIVGQKDLLIAVVDTILPKDFLDTLEHFLEQLLVLSDDGTMETAIRQLGNVLGTMGADPDFGPALSRLALRNGYRPTRTAAGLVHTIVYYDKIDDFIGKSLSFIAKGGAAEAEWKQLLTAASFALRTAQPVAQANAPDRTLRLALNLLTSRHPDLATGTARPLVTRDYRGLALAAVDAKGKVLPPFVDMDNDGLADVDANGHFVDAAGNVLTPPSPFPQLGVTDSAPRDTLGRALTAPNATTTLYQYLDLDGTVFGGLARETLALMSPDPKKDITFGLGWGVGALLGPRTMKTQTYTDNAGKSLGSLTYNGFDVTQAPVLDLVHGLLQLLGDPNADQTFQSTYTLLNQYESPTARLVGAMLDASDTGKQYPNAVVPPNSVLYDDLMVIVNRILAIPGLPEDLMDALENPAVKDFAPMMARMMVARNQVDFVRQQTAFPLLQNGNDLDVIDPVDRTIADSDYNRSIMQRIAHLIHDSNGVEFCNKQGATPHVIGLPAFGSFDKCAMFRIPDLALFYALSMTSQAAKDANPSAKSGADFCAHLTTNNVLLTGGCPTLIGGLVGIDGFGQYPTPASLNRSLFLENKDKPSTTLGGTFLADTTDDIYCSDGDRFIDAHNKSLMAWEVKLKAAPSGNPNATFYTAVQPLIDAFAKHDECLQSDPIAGCTKSQNAAKIFVDLLAVLHTHWTSPNGSYFGHKYQSTDPTKPRFAYPDNVVSYEPLLAQVLSQGDLMPAVLALAPTLNHMTVDGASGPLARPFIIGTAKYLFQFGGAPGLTYRNGATQAFRSDGTTPVPQVTPYYLIADAYAHKRSALAAASADQAAAWKRATSALVDQLLTIQKNPNGTFQFANRRFRAISLITINFLRSRIAAHAKSGDLAQWVHQTLINDLTDKLGGPTFAAVADFTAKIEGDSDARTQMYNLFEYLVDEADNDVVFQTALTTLADQVQMFLDDPDLVPVAHVLGSALDPTNGAVDAQLTLTKRAHDLDTAKALLTILRNLYKQDPVSGVYPASTLADILSELNRAQPGHGGDLSGDDYKAILNGAKSFLLDEQHGFMRFQNIVESRGPK
jgi:hypothetical protein